MLRTLLHAACLLCLSCQVCAAPALAQGGPPWPDPTGIPAVSDADVAAAVDLAGGNRAELEAALAYFPAGSTELAALRFVVANLPLADLGCITSAELTGNVELALAAWRDLPFEPFYDGATWAHYVLPHRVSQEPLEPWREHFYTQLAPLVADCATPEEAWRVVFDWCGQRAGFKQTQRRDQACRTPALPTRSGGFHAAVHHPAAIRNRGYHRGEAIHTRRSAAGYVLNWAARPTVRYTGSQVTCPDPGERHAIEQ